MTNYKFTDETRRVVHVIDSDGKSRQSMLVSTLPPDVIVLDPDPVPVEIPQTISRLQAKVALYNADLLAAVDQYMKKPDTPFLHKLAWEEAQEFDRHSPLILALAPLLDITEEQLDILFIAGSQVEI